MPTFTHFSEKGPIGIKQPGDPEPGESVGPMGLPATYRKGPYIPAWAVARSRTGQGGKGKPRSWRLLSLLVLMFFGCAPVALESEPGQAMIQDACIRCPYCCSSDDDEPMTDQEFTNFCISENQHRLTAGWSPARIESYCSIGQ